MSVSLYHTQRIRGFQQQKVKCSGRTLVFQLKKSKFNCMRCGSHNVIPEVISQRRVHGEPMGHCRKVVLSEFTTHRIYCRNCYKREMEHIPFLSHPKARITRLLERTILELRQHMSIQATANYFHIRWHAVKDLEKKQLSKKYSRIQTAHIKYIGIDKIHVGSGKGGSNFLTIIRDLKPGAVSTLVKVKALPHWVKLREN
jgi:transposase